MNITSRLLQKTSEFLMNLGYIFLSSIIFPILLSREQKPEILAISALICAINWILSYYLDIQHSIVRGGKYVLFR